MKQETSQINHLTSHLKQLENEEQKPPKLEKERNHKDQIRNKRKRNEGNNSKDQ